MGAGAVCAICACAVCCCACVTAMLVSVRNDADPIRVAIRDAVGFIIVSPGWAQFCAALLSGGSNIRLAIGRASYATLPTAVGKSLSPVACVLHRITPDVHR